VQRIPACCRARACNAYRIDGRTVRPLHRLSSEHRRTLGTSAREVVLDLVSTTRYPFPGIVQYVYLDEHGREIKHGPLVERGVRGNTVVLSRTGFYIEDQPDGVFTEYQTYWGTKVAETRYVHGKQVDLKMYPVPSLPARQ